MSNFNKKTKDELLARIFEQDKVIAAVRKEVKDSRENVAKAREQVAKSTKLLDGYREAMDMSHTKIMELRKNIRYWRRLWLLTTIAFVVYFVVKWLI